MTPTIPGFIASTTNYGAAKAVLFGAPYDSTTSGRPGARFGPGAIRADSWGLETYSPYQDKDLEDLAFFDAGDLELPFGDSAAALALIEEQTRAILETGKLPFLLGGEHLVTLGAVRAVAAKYPDLHLIHFDAHADLREDYLGVKLSHACVIRRCWETLGDGRIAQFGIRSGTREEFTWAQSGHTALHKFGFFGIEELDEGLPKLMESLAAKKVPVYLTVDIDVLDPSIMPGTGTPEAGGISAFAELLSAVLYVFKANVVACDLVELAPGLDPSGVSTATAAKLVREMLLAI
ncbi:MAG: agmatinase [Oscillospiraceae bacterium]|nr:agmatinase [Oscillospiraceae bacterium]